MPDGAGTVTNLHGLLFRYLNLVHRGRDLVVRIGVDGVALKGRRERWSSAVTLTWQEIFDVAAKVKARRVVAERKAARAARRAA